MNKNALLLAGPVYFVNDVTYSNGKLSFHIQNRGLSDSFGKVKVLIDYRNYIVDAHNNYLETRQYSNKIIHRCN